MRKSLFIIPLIIVLVASIIVAVEFSSGPTIAPFDDNSPTTEDAITCSWTPSDDTIQQNATWYNGSTQYGSVTTYEDNSSHQISLNAFIARKGENWWCNITLFNGTHINVTAVNVTIKNAPPSAPNATDETLYEDVPRSIPIESTDSDNDSLTYFILGSNPTYCTIGASTGIIDCNPTASDNGSVEATFVSSDGGSYLAKTNVTYTVEPVNDPPVIQYTNLSASEGTPFYYNISASDEEGDFPINFTLESNLASLNSSVVNGSTITLFFERTNSAPTFADVGYWWIRINATDNGSSTDTPHDDPDSSAFFYINVTSINHAPNITTNFSEYTINGTQGGGLVFQVNASDNDTSNSISFDISSNCSLPNPWNITTVNSSYDNASGEVNIAVLNNTHIACRWVNITAFDGQESDWEMVFLNLTNTNDAPVMSETSYDDNNSNGNTNMSNLTAIRNMPFYFQVNVTDPDSFTYEGEVLTFSDNSSNDITVDSATGVISFVPNETHIGNHTINITVVDNEGLFDFKTLRLEVRNNTAPVLVPIGNFTCVEDSLCQKYVNATDLDVGEDLLFSSNNTDLFAISDVNETTWLLNFTPVNSQVGNYSINITVEDKYGFTDSEVFLFTINNTNDAPFFDEDRDNVSDPVVFGTVVETYPVQLRVNVTDEDLLIGLDNLTYSWEMLLDNHNLNASISFIDEGVDYFIIGFTPEIGDADNYSINLSVVDNAGATYWENVSFEILPKSFDPVVEEIMPYWNSSLQTTVFGSFANTSLFSNDRVSVNVSENTSVTFDAMVVNDTSFVGNSLTYYWYVDGVLNQTLTDVTPGVDSSFVYSYDFFDEGLQEITLVAEDGRYAVTNWTWNVSVSNVNRPPAFYNVMPNITVNKSSSYIDFMSHFTNASGWQQLFYDPDDDINNDGQRGSGTGEATSLTYSISPGYGCSLATISFSGDDLDINPGSEGTCLVKFRATDPYNESVDSNLVWITITAIETIEVETPVSSGGSSTETRTVPYPFEEPVEVPEPLELITPENVLTYANQTVEIPMTIGNTWDDAIYGIQLNATTTNSSYTPHFKFSVDYIPVLQKDENYSVTLTIDNYRAESPLSVVVGAQVTDPEYEDSATILISSMEQRQGGEDAESKVVFARDLLNDNPECQELNELLDQADVETKRGNSGQAIKLIDTVVNGCKYIINEQKEVESETPKSFLASMTISPAQIPALIVGGVIILVLLVFGIIMVVSGRKDNYNI